MQITKSCFLVLGFLVFVGCYGSPAFEGELIVNKEGQADSGSEEPCVGNVGKAVLSWLDTQAQVPTLEKYTIMYGVESGNYSNFIELPPTGGSPLSKMVENEQGDLELKDFQKFIYELENLERGFTYYFSLKATNSCCDSTPSDEVFKKFELCPTGTQNLNIDL